MDARLIRKAQTGDKEALEELWGQTKAFAFTVARRFYATAYADYDDLQQSAYLGFHCAVMRHTGQYDFLALVRWSTRRECQKALGIYGGRRQVHTESLDIILPDGESAPIDLLEDESLPEICANIEEDELVRDVRAAVRELPWRERHVIVKHWFEGLTFLDIGKEMGVSSSRIQQIEACAFEQLRSDAILRSYAYCPPAIHGTAFGGLAHFINTGSSVTEAEALRRIRIEDKHHMHQSRRNGYAALLASLKAKEYISPDIQHTLDGKECL